MKAVISDVLLFSLTVSLVIILGHFIVDVPNLTLETISKYTADIATTVIIVLGLQVIITLGGKMPIITIAIASMAVANVLWDASVMFPEMQLIDAYIDMTFDLASIITMIAFYKMTEDCNHKNKRFYSPLGRRKEDLERCEKCIKGIRDVKI